MGASRPTFVQLVFFGIILPVAAGCTVASKSGVSVDYYQIGGRSLEQLDQEIKEKGPRINGNEHAVAVSNIRMIPDIALLPGPKGCIVSRANINVQAKITLPRWINRKDAERRLARAWDNLDRYTRLHEAVHVTIAHKYAKQLEMELKTLRTGRSCSTTKKIVRATIKRTLRDHEREQLAFDASEKKRFAKLAGRRGRS